MCSMLWLPVSMWHTGCCCGSAMHLLDNLPRGFLSFKGVPKVHWVRQRNCLRSGTLFFCSLMFYDSHKHSLCNAKLLLSHVHNARK